MGGNRPSPFTPGKAGWVPLPVWVLWRIEKSLSLSGFVKRFPSRPARSLVPTPIDSQRLQSTYGRLFLRLPDPGSKESQHSERHRVTVAVFKSEIKDTPCYDNECECIR